MFLIIPFAIIVLLKALEVSFMDNFSWWWIVLIAFLIFLWFEYFEVLLGLNKRPEDLQHEKMKKERLKRSFKNKIK